MPVPADEKTPATPLDRIALYARVNTDDQRDRQTIRTQLNVMRSEVERDSGVIVVSEYIDDGISGIVPMAERHEGGRLLRDADQRLFDQVWVYRFDRLGRDDIDPLTVFRRLEDQGVTIRSVTEGYANPFMRSMHVAFSAEERRAFRARSMAGIEQAVRNGRFPGGIVAYGYRAEGEQGSAELVPDETVVWGDLTAADVIRLIFKMAGEDCLSTIKIANELNTRGVPTSYAKDGREVERRGQRKKRTQNTWRPGRVLQILNNATYRGEYTYGKRPNKGKRSLITVQVPELVSSELWFAAQKTLASRARVPHDKRRKYLLSSKLKCDNCGLNYSGSMSRGRGWYRCNGQLVGRGPFGGRCPAKSIKGGLIESAIWEDIRSWVENPGDILGVLRKEMDERSDARTQEKELASFHSALGKVESKRDRLLDLYLDGNIPRDQLDPKMESVRKECEVLSERIQNIEVGLTKIIEPHDPDLLTQLRRRLEVGTSEELKLELFQLLVEDVVVQTTVHPAGKKSLKLSVTYNFAVAGDSTGRDSSQQRA